MPSFTNMFAELHVLLSQMPSSEFRVNSDGVLVRTAGTHIEINDQGVLVQRHEPAPPPPDMARFSPRPLWMIFAFILLILLIKAPRKAAFALVVLVGMGLLFGGVYLSRHAHVAPPHQAGYQALPHVEPMAGLAHLHMPHSMGSASSVTVERERPALEVEESTPPAPPMAVAGASEITSEVSSTVSTDSPFLVFHGDDLAGIPVAELPSWVGHDSHTATPSLMTLSSERFASIAEAERQLWRRAGELAAQELSMRFPEAAGWMPPEHLLQRQNIILERCIERTTLAVGNFTEPMFRVHWQVKFPPELTETLARAWSPTVTNRRVLALGGVLAVLTGIFAVLNLMLRGLSSNIVRRMTGRGAVAAILALLGIVGMGVLLA